jgi:hypothetical protein
MNQRGHGHWGVGRRAHKWAAEGSGEFVHIVYLNELERVMAGGSDNSWTSWRGLRGVKMTWQSHFGVQGRGWASCSTWAVVAQPPCLAKMGCGSENVSFFEKRIRNFTYLTAGATTHLLAARKLTQMTLQLAFGCKGGWLHVCVLSASRVRMQEVVGLVAVVSASVSWCSASCHVS